MEPINPMEPKKDQPPSAPTLDGFVKPETATPSPQVQPSVNPEPVVSSTSTMPEEAISSNAMSQPTAVENPNPSVAIPEMNATAQAMQQPVVATHKKRKWLIPAVVAAVVILGAGAGYVFGFYLPNQPEAVFNKAMTQSGQAVDKLVEYTQSQTGAEYSGATMDGTMNFKSAQVSFDATMDGKSDGKNADLSLTANIVGQKVNLDLKAVDVSSSENPDLYLKVSGVQPYLDEAGLGALSSLDGQWISVDHTILDTYQKQLESAAGASATGTPTAEQVDDAIARVQVVNKEYLFTDNAEKAVVMFKSFVGTEQRNGRDTNHYTVSYDKEHLKAYVTALATALDESKLNEWVKEQNDGKNISELLRVKDFDKTAKNLKGDETFDVYVDKETKLVQSVVFTDTSEDNPGTLTIAQNYTGGDTYPFQLAADYSKAEDPGTMTLDLSANTKTNKLTMNLKLETTSTDAMSLDMNVNITPTKDKVDISAPAGAKSINEVLQQLGLDESIFDDSAGVLPVGDTTASELNVVNL